MDTQSNSSNGDTSLSPDKLSSTFCAGSPTWVKYCKKMRTKDRATQDLMAETYTIAQQVLMRIAGIPFYELTMSVFVYCKDENCRFLSRDFEACLELASIDPIKFSLNLHSFYNSLSSKLRKPGMLMAFAQFIHTFMRLRYTKQDKGINENVILAYTDLILNTLFYLRPNKLDNSVNLVGVSLNGEPLSQKNDFPFISLVAFQALEQANDGEADNLWRIYQKSGFPVDDMASLERLHRNNRIAQNISGALLPFINEYTFDIVDGIAPPLFPRFIPRYQIQADADVIKTDLMSRRRTLPVNGLKIVFDDPALFFKELFLKEVVMYDQVYMLYRLQLKNGDICGYYATKSKFFYSILLDTKDKSDVATAAFEFISKTILFLYAAYVRPDKYDYAQYKELATFLSVPIELQWCPHGGVLKDMYHKEDASHIGAGKKDKSKYEEHETMVNGYIRQLPAGHKASQTSIETALRLGYSLKPGEVYVSPFIKRTFRLKSDTPE